MFRLWKILREAEWFTSLLSLADEYKGRIITFIAAVPAMTYLASISEWLDSYGPVAWAFAGLLGFFFLVWSGAGLARLSLWVAQKDVLKRVQNPDHNINPLDQVFNNNRIKLDDLAHPVTRLIENKTISHCELIGPAVLIIDGGTMRNFNFHDCDLIRANTGVSFRNGYVLRNCTITNSRIFRVTVIVDARNSAAIEKLKGFSGWTAG